LAKTILNSLSANIAILDENGVILETNETWKNFAMKNEMIGSNDSIEWMRAGHDPAILYDPVVDDFHELHGSGMAFGKPAIKVVRCLVERLFTISFVIIQRPVLMKLWRPLSAGLKSF
jgi:hypothetical protein